MAAGQWREPYAQRGVATISWHRDGSRIKNSLAASARLASIEANAARG